MTSPFNPFIAEEILVAERLVEAFDNQDGQFGEYFETADRVTLGALIAYASLAMRELAARDDVPLHEIRQRLRAAVAGTAAAAQQNGEPS